MAEMEVLLLQCIDNIVLSTLAARYSTKSQCLHMDLLLLLTGFCSKHQDQNMLEIKGSNFSDLIF